MEIYTISLPTLGTNCYIVKVSQTEAVVIDPGENAKKINDAVTAKGLCVCAILLTHGHFDHTGAAAELKKLTEKTPKVKKGEEAPPAKFCPIYIHSDDKPLLSDPIGSFAFFMPDKELVPFEPDKEYKDGDRLTFGDVTFTVVETPGHSAGSVCLLCEGEDGQKIMFSGDTLFKDSIGRSDGTGASYEVLMNSLEKLAGYDDSYLVYPGHGPQTKLGVEKRFNPFLAGIN